MRWKIIHNGYDIQWVNRESDIDNYIQSVLESHSDLRPRKIMDRKIKAGDNQIRIVRYIYVTLYEEDFIIAWWHKSSGYYFCHVYKWE